jgi:hypothetical protein
MRNNLVIFLLSIVSFGFNYAQNFPISYKIERNFDECNQCQVKTRSKWVLLNPENYSSDIKEVIEYKIFTEKAYPEKAQWYFKEQGYDKDCEVTRSGKHVWNSQKKYENGVLTKEYFLSFQNEEAKKRNEEAKKIAEENKQKNHFIESYNFYKKMYSEIDLKRQKSELLKKNNQTEQFLLNQKQIFENWLTLDSLYYSDSQWWYFNNLDVNEFNFSQYYQDLNELAWNLIIAKKYNEAYEALNIVFKNNIVIFENIVRQYQIGFYLAGNYCHSILLSTNSGLSNDEKYEVLKNYYFRKFNNEEFSKEWTKMMIQDYSEFEKQGILKNADSLKFMVKSCVGTHSISISKNASQYTKEFLEKQYESIYGYFGKIEKKYNRIKEVDSNLFVIYYPYYNDGKDLYFYLDKNGNIIVVNLTNNGLNEKRLNKVINESIEIKSLDLKTN